MQALRHKTLKRASALGWVLACALAFGTAVGVAHDHGIANAPEPCVVCAHGFGDDVDTGTHASPAVHSVAGIAYLPLESDQPFIRAIRGVCARAPPAA